MTLKDVERRHEERISFAHTILGTQSVPLGVDVIRISQDMVEKLEAERTKDLQCVTEFQSAHGIPNPCQGVGSNHANLISAREAQEALRAASGIQKRAQLESDKFAAIVTASEAVTKTVSEMSESELRKLDERYKDLRPASYRSIMEDAIRCGAAMTKTTQTPITSLEELDNLYQQIREQFIKENP